MSAPSDGNAAAPQLAPDDEAPPPRRHLPVVQGSRGRTMRSGARSATVSIRRMSKRQLAAEALAYPPGEFAHVARPETRADCEGHEGPCPWVSCAWHLYMEVNEDNGNFKVTFPDLEVWEMPETCALDVIDAHPDGLTLDDLGAILNVTRERIRQIEGAAAGLLEGDRLARALAGVESVHSRGEVADDTDASGARTDRDALDGLHEIALSRPGAGPDEGGDLW